VVRQALLHNAASVIIAHNHPSGVVDPSQADEGVTRRVRQALALVEIRLLDHLIVGDGRCYSFSEHGLRCIFPEIAIATILHLFRQLFQVA